jgi:hypothetical protein
VIRNGGTLLRTFVTCWGSTPTFSDVKCRNGTPVLAQIRMRGHGTKNYRGGAYALGSGAARPFLPAPALLQQNLSKARDGGVVAR